MIKYFTRTDVGVICETPMAANATKKSRPPRNPEPKDLIKVKSLRNIARGMKHLVRLLVVVLVALAVPVQGALAVAAGQCMALEHHDGGDGHDHASHSDSEQAGSEQADGGAENAHCGPCTACCASASMAGPAALTILSAASNAPYLFSPFPPIGVQPDGVDRPPLAL